MKFNSMFVEINHVERKIYKLKDESLRCELESINTEIVNKFNLVVPNRNAIIKSLIQFLSQGSIYCNQSNLDATCQEFYIIKSDIASFFPSINKHKLYKKIVKSSLLKDNSLETIKTFIFNSGIAGIPLGMPFSNAISEVYLEEFDDAIRREFSPIFYVRYVDDILIIKNYPKGKKINENREKQLLCGLLDKINLSANDSKTKIYTFKEGKNRLEFEYLGYNFSVLNKKLYIDIAEKKYNKKILNRLVRYFKFYNSSARTDEDFWMLYYRIKNLVYGVTSCGRKGINHKLKFGIGFNYKFINSVNMLKRLLKTFHYFRNKYAHKFTSAQTAYLFSLVTVYLSSGEKVILNQSSKDEDILLLLNKRVSYTKYSTSKLEKIATQIGCPSIKRDRESLYRYNLQIQIMKKLRVK